jgi:hypothetical protein
MIVLKGFDTTGFQKCQEHKNKPEMSHQHNICLWPEFIFSSGAAINHEKGQEMQMRDDKTPENGESLAVRWNFISGKPFPHRENKSSSLFSIVAVLAELPFWTCSKRLNSSRLVIALDEMS